VGRGRISKGYGYDNVYLWQLGCDNIVNIK
jgi:hypothetical protein